MEVKVFVRYRDRFIKRMGESAIEIMKLTQYESLKKSILMRQFEDEYWEIMIKEIQLIKPKTDFEPSY